MLANLPSTKVSCSDITSFILCQWTSLSSLFLLSLFPRHICRMAFYYCYTHISAYSPIIVEFNDTRYVIPFANDGSNDTEQKTAVALSTFRPIYWRNVKGIISNHSLVDGTHVFFHLACFLYWNMFFSSKRKESK